MLKYRVVRAHMLCQGGVHDLRVARQQRLHHRDADAAAQIASQAENRRALIAQRRRQSGECRGRQRHVDEAGTQPLRESGPHDRGGAHLQIEARHLPRRKGRQRKAGADDQPKVDLTHDAPDEEHREQRAEAPRRRDETGGDHRVVEQILQQGRQQRERGEQDHTDDENERVAGQKVPILEQGGTHEPFPGRRQHVHHE